MLVFLLSILQELLQLRWALFGSSFLGFHYVCCIDGVHGIGIDRYEEARDGEGNKASNNEDESGILHLFSIAGDVLDEQVDNEGC